MLSIIALILPNLAIKSLVFLIAIVLVITGIEKIISGLLIIQKLRFITVGLGVLTVLLAGLALSFPVEASRVVIFVLGFSLMVNGFSRIADGLTNKSDTRLTRGFTVGVGILAVIVFAGINIFPLWGKLFISKLIVIELIIMGIQMITTGTVNVEAGEKKIKEKIKKIFQRDGRSKRKE